MSKLESLGIFSRGMNHSKDEDIRVNYLHNHHIGKRRTQAIKWCQANDKTDLVQSTPIPGKLPSLLDGLLDADSTAIELSWRYLEGLDSVSLGLECTASILQLMKKP
jgi:hypothetical protein